MFRVAQVKFRTGRPMPDDMVVVRLDKKALVLGAGVAGAILVAIGLALGWSRLGPGDAVAAGANGDQRPTAGIGGKSQGPPSLLLSETQTQAVKVEAVGDHLFPRERQAVGNIDFNEDRSVQVYPPYQGLILQLFAKVGDDVRAGQTLFTIQSPDLIQAESTLIAAAGVLDLTSRALGRARQLYAVQGIAQKDLEQAVSDQQTAEGNLRASRDAVRVFGKSEAEIDWMVQTRRIDPALVVPAPLAGRITARSAAPGDMVQPGTPPAPYAMADLSTIWMLAFVPESDSALYHLGQEVKVSVLAYGDRVFEGKITTLGTTVDPNTHRLMLRVAIADPRHELRPNMLATFVIRTGDPVRATAVPADAVVREPDGTMTVWVTTDKRHFTQRIVTLGLQHGGYDQITDGVKPGEQVATDGAILLDAVYATAASG
jgi:membrane fusion protein, heavy metal efflux system